MEQTFVIRTDDKNFREALSMFISEHCDKNRQVNFAIYDLNQEGGKKVMEIVNEKPIIEKKERKLFALRSKEGQIITSCDIENPDEEVTYTTKEEANQALIQLEKSLPKGIFKVVEI